MNAQKTAVTCAVVLSFVLLASSVFAQSPRPKPGDNVAAKWTNGSYYSAMVTGTDGGQYNVLYEDGEKGQVDGSGVVVIQADAPIKVGDHVLACWKSAQMFPGVVVAKTDYTYTVKWDDGDAPLEVARGRVVLHP